MSAIVGLAVSVNTTSCILKNLAKCCFVRRQSNPVAVGEIKSDLCDKAALHVFQVNDINCLSSDTSSQRRPWLLVFIHPHLLVFDSLIFSTARFNMLVLATVFRNRDLSATHSPSSVI